MATLKDVAQLAGVGLATESRAISGSDPVSEDAQRCAQAAIEQMEFLPSSLGRSLSKQSLGMIGIFAPSYVGAYYGTILNQTDHELRAVGFASTGELLAKGATFTGLFCANDEMAVGALSRLHRTGVRVPEQVSIVGYGDYYSAALTAPELTTIHFPIKEMTQSAARWLFNRRHGTTQAICREFPVEVKERKSVAQLNCLQS